MQKQKKKRQQKKISEQTVDRTLEDSFPTSDPPSWTTGREPADSDAPQAPREKRAEPRDRKSR